MEAVVVNVRARSALFELKIKVTKVWFHIASLHPTIYRDVYYAYKFTWQAYEVLSDRHNACGAGVAIVRVLGSRSFFEISGP